MHKSDWDDLRYVLAVAETGSLSGAARGLGVNHATVLRHVQSFEDAHGGPVFNRTAQGYELLPERQRVIETAREVANSMESVQRLMQGGQAPVRGTVRISATDTLCTTLLPGIASRIMARADGLRIELRNNNAHVDFARMQADIAVRPAKTLPDDMMGQAACDLGFAHYAAADAPDMWLGLCGALSRALPADWMTANVAPTDISGASDSFVTLRDMAGERLGHAILPCILGDNDPRLHRITGRVPLMRVPLWVASHVDLIDAPRIRVVRTRLVRHLAANSDRLSGDALTG